MILPLDTKLVGVVCGSELERQGSLVLSDLPEVCGSQDISRNFHKSDDKCQ
jgi:hypothetical protein